MYAHAKRERCENTAIRLPGSTQSAQPDSLEAERDLVDMSQLMMVNSQRGTMLLQQRGLQCSGENARSSRAKW